MTETPTEDFQDRKNRKNTGRVIVAVPTATEPVHHMGDVSEPKHTTLLWLGKPEENPELDTEAVAEAVRSVAEQIGGPLTAPVEKQGTLGDDGAQVVFLGGDEVTQAHDALLADPTLKGAYDAVEQKHPEFTPHLTLGYEPDVAAGDDIPQEVIFDRLALWDGDEHTEFPLGPSASTEENTDGPEAIEPVLAAHAAALARNKQVNAGVLYIPETLSAAEGFEAAIVESMLKPIAINDAASLAAAVEQCADGCGTAQMATRPILMKRARELGCQHLIPTAWLRRPTAVPAATVTAVPALNGTQVADPFALKTQLSTLSDTALRAAYIRGVREYAMTAPQSRPPLHRDVIAQARVNSLIRLAQGDPSARTDDRDLLQ
jgi:2'-5' RNA ligase